ncbi:MAG: MoxR family ATPase [Spirochaetes bacterium]|nr:MoxR family ATPase [Spirochaetota bacterium]
MTQSPQQTAAKILEKLNSVLLDKPEVTKALLAGWLAGGHILIEDIPGVGKTTLAKAFAIIMGLSFGRIQFTPDLMPSDITGSTILDPEKKNFIFRKGPVFHEVILADEINRSSPKTQSSLLQAMEERQVSIDDTTYDLPENFMVIATQNPVEYHGTFPLPEAQLDRFIMRLAIGYPSYEKEMDIAGNLKTSMQDLSPLLDAVERTALRNAAAAITTNREILQYAVNIVSATRNNSDFLLGASPRASIDLVKTGTAMAFLSGRDYVIPDDLKAVASLVLSHRLILSAEARMGKRSAESLVQDLLNRTYVPKYAE